MYDIQREDSFINIKKWLKEAKIQSDPETLFFLIGNQADNEDTRTVTQQRAEEFKAKMKLDGFYETSAFNGQNVETVFIDAASKLYRMNTDPDDQMMMPSLKSKIKSSLSTASSKPNDKEFTKLTMDKHDSKADFRHRKKKKG